MKRIYDLKLVYDYIWGNDIKDYSVDDLENDPDFMLEVIERTKDKKMYELCSDAVKSDYRFVREVIELFNSDLKFISSVVDFYLDSLSDAEKEQGLSYPELNIIMSGLCGRSINNYSIRASAFYEFERVRIKACINGFDDSSMREESKEGFILTAVEYEASPIIIDFVAKRMVNEAIYGEKYNSLENLIHKRFKSIEDFESYGEVRFLHDCVYQFDRSLGTYTAGNRPEMFEMFFGQALKDVASIKSKWPFYIDRVNFWRVNAFEYEMNKYMLDNSFFGNLSYDDVVTYVANKFGVLDVFRKFDSEFSSEYVEDKYRVLEVNDVLCINKAMELAQKLFSVDVIDDSYDDYDDSADKERIPNNQKSMSHNVIRFQLAESENRSVKK